MEQELGQQELSGAHAAAATARRSGGGGGGGGGGGTPAGEKAGAGRRAVLEGVVPIHPNALLHKRVDIRGARLLVAGPPGIVVPEVISEEEDELQGGRSGRGTEVQRDRPGGS